MALCALDRTSRANKEIEMKRRKRIVVYEYGCVTTLKDPENMKPSSNCERHVAAQIMTDLTVLHDAYSNPVDGNGE